MKDLVFMVRVNEKIDPLIYKELEAMNGKLRGKRLLRMAGDSLCAYRLITTQPPSSLPPSMVANEAPPQQSAPTDLSDEDHAIALNLIGKSKRLKKDS